MNKTFMLQRMWVWFRQWGRGSLVIDSTFRVLMVGALLAALFAMGSMAFIRDQETKRLMAHVDALLSTVESSVSVACFTGDATLAGDISRGLLTNKLVAGVRISAGKAVLTDRLREGTIKDERFVVTRPIPSPFGAGDMVGEVTLVADGEFIRAQAMSYSQISAIFLVMELLAVSIAVALVMLHTVVRPIREFSRRVHDVDINASKVDAYVIPPEGNEKNEIGRLAADFNIMIGNVRDLLAAEHAMQEEIATRERRFRTLVENSPDIIARYDRDFRRVFVNPAYAHETGTPIERALQRPVEDDTIWRPHMSCEEYQARLRHVMLTGKPDHVLLEWHRDDGRLVSHEMYIVAEYDGNGQVEGTLAIGRDMTERLAVERLLQRQASYDALTGLLNRRMFGERLREEIAHAERTGTAIGVLFIDLDRFKEVNDTLGHEVGDLLLVDAARRLTHCVRESDIVARLGGDEFIVVVPNAVEAKHLARIAGEIIQRMEQPFHVDGNTCYISASIGITRFPEDATQQETLLSCADQAMYAAKEQGRNGFSFFTREMQMQSQNRLHLANDLREALANNQLQVWFQPIAEVATGEVVKAEALLRWVHPDRGMVSPAQFVPIAEENGCIHDIGNWVFQRSALMAKKWSDLFPSVGGDAPSISVNLSPRQFTRGDFSDHWAAYINEIGLQTESIVVEITEGLLLSDASDILGKLENLRAAGMQVALDDFGTGYSAMAYLKKFPIDYLKIDRSFVRDIDADANDRAIAEAIVAMAHKLGIKVVAEGVETEAQRDILASVGCEYLQGYLYAKPMPEDEFLAYVSHRAAPRVKVASL